MGGVEYQVTKVDPTDPETKGMVYQVHKVSEEIAATLGGKVYRARIINDPTDPTVAGKVYQIVLIGDPSDPAVKGKVYNAILTGGSEAVVVGPAVSPLALPDAIADSLVYVKAFGGTEQNGTPTPDAPVDIVSNNGVLRIQGSATGTVTQTGNPTPTTPVAPEFYQNHGLLLRAIGTDADVYDASTQTITRAIGYYIFDGTESFGTSNAYGKALYISSGASVWGANRNKDVLCQYFLGTSSPSGSNMPEFTCFFNQIGHFYFRTPETATDFKAWLAELYANGTPLILWFVKSTPATESFTPSVYADGTVETINVHGKNLFDKNNLPERIHAYFANSGTTWTFINNGYCVRIPCLPNKTYTARYNGNSTQAVLSFASMDNDTIPTAAQPSITVTQAIRQNSPTINTPISLTTGANDKWLIVQYNAADPQNTDMADNLQIEFGSTATTYAQYYNGGTATAEMLLKVGDYQDVQSILDGVVTRNIGVKVLDGAEVGWTKTNNSFANNSLFTDKKIEKSPLICSHFQYNTGTTSTIPDGCVGCASTSTNIYFRNDALSTVEDWKQWLASQYAADTPVIVVYPLATPTTESVTGQTLQVTDGDNVLEITQASLTGLELEAQYDAAVSLTIQEVQDANLDPNVEVTIN